MTPSTWSSATPASPPPATPSTPTSASAAAASCSSAQGLAAGAREIDAAGRVVTPGGVDAHCHLDQPMAPPVRMADDFDTGTRSAACGGTTTVIPFAAQEKGQSLRAAVDDYHRRAEGRAHVDYAFHLIVSDPTPTVLNEELPALIARGLHLVQDLHDLRRPEARRRPDPRRARRSRAQHGAMAMIHAENADCIEWLTKRLEAAGRTAPRFHAHSRPMLVEREATHRAIALAELVDVPILIVHVSGREAVEQIRWARAHGLTVFAETCPQYLFLTADDLGIDDSYHGARCVCSPPPRDKANQEVIWDGLDDGLFTVFSSDHAPFNVRRAGGQEAGRRGGRRSATSRTASPASRRACRCCTPKACSAGRMTLNKFVELTATNPAKAYGLHPRKGTIAVGSDADLVIWDERELVLRNEQLHHAVDYTPYEGMRLRAWPGADAGRRRGRVGRQRLPCPRRAAAASCAAARLRCCRAAAAEPA